MLETCEYQINKYLYATVLCNLGKKLGDRTSYILWVTENPLVSGELQFVLWTEFVSSTILFFTQTPPLPRNLSVFNTWPLGKSSVTILTYFSNGVIFSAHVWSFMSCSPYLGSPRGRGRWAQDFPTLWYWELTASSVSLCRRPNNCHTGKEVEENNKSVKKKNDGDNTSGNDRWYLS